MGLPLRGHCDAFIIQLKKPLHLRHEGWGRLLPIESSGDRSRGTAGILSDVKQNANLNGKFHLTTDKAALPCRILVIHCRDLVSTRLCTRLSMI